MNEQNNTNDFSNAMSTEMDKLKNLRSLIKTTLHKVAYETKNKITYVNKKGCDKDNFKRIFKIYFSYQNLRNKPDALQKSLYITIYVLWSRIDQKEKDTFLEESKNPKMCAGVSNVPETFEALDLICKWVRLNALVEDESLPYLIYDLQNVEELETNETNLMLLPKINAKIKEINKILATFPEDINLMTHLYDLIVMFHNLKDNSTSLDSSIIQIIYGKNYYRNIYSTIVLFWRFIQNNVPSIDRHPKYQYIIMNMLVLEKTDQQNKLMDKITRSTLKKLKDVIPKKPENVNKLRNAKLYDVV
jgi:hypothetical protein